ncbi:MAG: CAP domain-containing protein [Ruminococcus sp.]|nr:CAP domain-containing protein [Ruminococcus sp.]
MKIFSKTMAVILSAVMILACAVPTACAAQTAPCVPIKVIRCQAPGCSEIQKLMDRFCCGSVCLNDILQSVKDCCPDAGNCIPVCGTPAQQPTEAVPYPTAAPTESVITPAKPTAAPTQPVEPSAEPTAAPTEKPTQPVETIAPAQPVSAEFNTNYEAEVLRLVNAERAAYGLSPLSMDDGAVQVAHLRAKEIVQSFSHTRPDGSSCFTAAKEFGVSYRTAGENIAYGYPSPQQVMNGWMNSEGHRRNILSASFSKVGIGCYESRGVLFWSQFFIG